jgi:hypothetical protein
MEDRASTASGAGYPDRLALPRMRAGERTDQHDLPMQGLAEDGDHMLNQEDIIRMARQAGMTTMAHDSRIERFAAAVATAEREKLAHWMRSMGYATGHGDAIEDLLDRLGTQIAEGLESEVLMEREACAKVCEGIYTNGDGAECWLQNAAAAIRARNNQ